MSTKKLLTRFKAMSLEVDAKSGLDGRSKGKRRILVSTTRLYGAQRQYELMQADDPDANHKKFTDTELDNLKEAREINRSIGKRLGAIKKAKKVAAEESAKELKAPDEQGSQGELPVR